MNSEEKYLDSKEFVEKIDKAITSSVINDKKCIKCEKVIKLSHISNIYLKSHMEQEKLIWDGGSISMISGNFASKHDFKKYYLCVCDECLTSAYENGIVENVEDVQRKYRSLENRKKIFRKISITDILKKKDDN